MKIVSLSAENFKRLRAVEIRPDGHMVQIVGKNGAGKTSVLDAIWAALAGAAAVPAVPIRTGESAARIKLDLGEIIVRRTFKRQEDGEVTTALSVENAEGVRYGSPQKMLDALLGELAFDPLAFARMAPKDQFETLRRFVPGVDFAAIDAATAADYAERTAMNRRAKESRTIAEGILVSADTPTQLEDESAIADALEQAGAHNARVAGIQKDRAFAAERLAFIGREVARLEKQIADLQIEAAAHQDAQQRPVPEALDTAAIRARLERAKLANQRYRDREKQRQHLTDASAFEQRAQELTRTMEIREADKRAAIAAAAMPVPDLDFGDGVVLKNGVPFAQASDAEKLRASVAIALAMNPKLPVIRIQDGSLLDAASLALVGEMAAAHDAQVWVERVAEDGTVGFLIEDGAVVAQEAAHA